MALCKSGVVVMIRVGLNQALRNLRLVIIRPNMPIPNNVKVQGSGVVTGASVALMIAKSPSLRSGGDEGKMFAVKVDRIVSVPGSSIVVGLKSPVRVAEVGSGFVPPMAMEAPLNDSPSKARVK